MQHVSTLFLAVLLGSASSEPVLPPSGLARLGNGDELHAIVPEPSSFDPVRSNKAHEVRTIALLHDALVRADPDRDVLLPALATSWDMSADGKRWTFHLRDDALTPDGLRFAAGDVLFSVGLYLDERLSSPHRPSLIVDGTPVIARAVDERTVEFETRAPSPFFPWMIQGLPMLPESRFRPCSTDLLTWARAVGETAAAEMLRGFGPFFVASKGPKEIVLDRNPGFWGRDEEGGRLPHLAKIHLALMDDATIAQTRFEKDERYVARLVSPLDRKGYVGRKEFRVVELGADESTMFFWLNQNPLAPDVDPEKIRIFQDVRFRRGIAQAIDRAEVVARAFLGHAQPLYGPISPAFDWGRPLGVDLEALTPASDVRRAREAIAAVPGVRLDAASETFQFRAQDGWKPLGFVLYTTPSPGDVRRIAADTVAAQLARIGIAVRVEVQDFDAVVARIDETFDYEACLMFLESSGHPSAMRGIFHSSAGMHFFRPYQQRAAGWEAEVDTAYEAYLSATDSVDGVRALARVLTLWVENQPVFYLATAKKALAVRAGVEIEGRGTTGKAGDPILDRPYVERIRIRR